MASGTARFRFDDGRMRIAFADVEPGAAQLAVDLAQRYARARNLSTYWIVMPQRAGEGELPAALLNARFRLSEHLLLMARRHQPLPPVRPDVTIEPITAWQAMCEYEYGSRQAFQEDPAPTLPPSRSARASAGAIRNMAGAPTMRRGSMGRSWPGCM